MVHDDVKVSVGPQAAARGARTVDARGASAYGFAGYTLDLRRGCLRHADREIELRPKSFDVLRLLVENAGRLMSKDEIIEAVWPSVVVTDESLTRCVSDVRSALADRERRIVKTVARRGYLLATPVSPLPQNLPDALGAERPVAMDLPRLSIVVLTIAHLGGEKDLDGLVGTIGDMLATGLAGPAGIQEPALATDRPERRLMAVLAADVAGYSRLMGADEEGTLAHLKAHRRSLVDPKIAEHRGRVVKTAGDGLLVTFASVVEALRCAVEIQRGMAERNADAPWERRIEFRMGLHQGDIVVDNRDIFGDGVNVAARLESVAEPGGICVSSRVQEDARGKLDATFEDAGDQRLKNIEYPVRVYRVRLCGASVSPRPPQAFPDKPALAVVPFPDPSRRVPAAGPPSSNRLPIVAEDIADAANF
jgi:class 3 adenylate cyclase/DNA-binding winged helix-turn-helix (wHTH) protein